MLYTSLGDAGVMGTSCHHLTLGATRIVVDAGRHPRTGDTPDLQRLRTLGADGVVLTHAHLDHCGALPLALRHLPGRSVFCTPATAALAELVLRHHLNRDADAAWGAGLLFGRDEVDAVRWRHAAWRQRETLGAEGLMAELYDAGHLVGASSVLFEGGGARVYCTGDLHLVDRAWQRGADLPEGPVDVLVCESTQGANDALESVEPEAVGRALVSALAGALARGARVLLPVFALGRAQEVLALLIRARAAGELPDVPVYLGGLAAHATRLAAKFEAEVRRVPPEVQLATWRTRPLTPAIARKPPPGPAIYLAGSGMVVEGSLAHVLAEAVLEDAGALLAFVGYLDPDTPGFALKAGRRTTRCAIESFPFTAHARRRDLVEVARRLRPADVVVVHGDEAARVGLSQALEAALPGLRVHRPGPGETLALEGRRGAAAR
jgi:Cft2 family RNA processing exonuclease